MKTITLCSSMSFYEDVMKIGKNLESTEFSVLYPESALIMNRKNDYNPKHFRKNLTPQAKGKFIKLHFDKIAQSDAILIINNTKNGMRGYIGANAAMEMGIAFHLGIKIYLLNKYPKSGPFHDEISAMNPTVLNGKIDTLRKLTS